MQEWDPSLHAIQGLWQDIEDHGLGDNYIQL